MQDVDYVSALRPLADLVIKLVSPVYLEISDGSWPCSYPLAQWWRARRMRSPCETHVTSGVEALEDECQIPSPSR